MERLNIALECKFRNDAPDGTFEGYGSVFSNEDYGGDVIKKGAFSKSLKEWGGKGKLPKMLLQHGGFWGGVDDMIPIGRWTDMKEDSKGLYCTGRLIAMDTDRGKSIYAAMKEGELDGLSIGYLARKFTLGTKPDEPYRSIDECDLKEVSVVVFGMNPKALIDSVKSASGQDGIDEIESLSDAERFLREAGAFSRKSAAAVVSRIKRIAQREAAEKAEALTLIRSVAARLRS